MSDHDHDMLPFGSQDDANHIVIQSAEVLGPVFKAPVAYDAMRSLAESSAFVTLRSLADARAKTE